MKVEQLFFTAPYQVEVRTVSLPPLEKGQVLVKTICSAISPGTESLVFQGQFHQGMVNPIDKFSSGMAYPFRYGYASVGEVIDLGEGVDGVWLGKRVFSFQAHSSHFISSIGELHVLPEDCSPESACFLANMETSVNLVQDARPILGEHVLVLGQGIVGLLTTALLADFPFLRIITVDRFSLRREASVELGVLASIDPQDSGYYETVESNYPQGADLIFELTGTPAALNDAIALSGFGGRVVIGSWYGERDVKLDLGSKFHHSRIKLISSQVSTISGQLSDRWDKERRFGVAWDALRRIQPARWVTHRFTLSEAAKAYQLITEKPSESIQVIFETT